MNYQLVLQELFQIRIFVIQNTKSLLIEGSIFNSAKIRQQSRI
jgi:hypothetical protein